MRNFASVSLLILSAFFTSVTAHALKWQDYRQSTNVIDVRAETKAVNTQLSLDAGRRYLVAMIAIAEKDATEHPECATLTQEIEKLKTLRSELEEIGDKPVRRLVCAEEEAGSLVNLCAKIRAKDPAAAPVVPDLKGFEEELTGNYGPAMEQLGRAQSAIEAKGAALLKEDLKCRATLQLIERKATELTDSYAALQKMIQNLRQ